MINVVVIGGGIAGLTTAIALRQKGFEPRVFEQAGQISEVGAGVQLAPNGLLQLHRLGLEDELEKVLSPFGPSSAYRFADGTKAGEVVTSNSQQTLPVAGIHRADLIEVLRQAVPEESIYLNHRLLGISESGGKYEVTFENGKSYAADLVIGADGIHSRVRDYVTEPSAPVFSGMNAYRGTVPHSRIPDWPTDAFQVWMGDGRHFLTFPVKGGAEINFVGFVPAESGLQESWSAVGDPDDLRAHFDGWDPTVSYLLDQVDATNWWGLYDREPLATWVHRRITLLGDAAHAMLPHVGQGANQAIEDAIVLASLLSQDGLNIDAALEAYEKVRLPRTAAIQSGSRQNGMRYDSQYEDLEQRDREIAEIADYRYSIYDSDALAALR